MSDLASDLNTLRNTRPRYFWQWLEQADPEAKELVMAAVRDPAIPSNQLAVMLTKKHNIPITRETIEGYRGARG